MWIVWLVAGLCLVIFGGAGLHNEHKIILGSRITEGRVADIAGSSRYRYPIVTFKTMTGRDVEFNANMTANFLTVKKGDVVRVAYSETAPEKARLLLFFYRFGLWYIPLALGLLVMFWSVSAGIGPGVVARLYAPSSVVERL